MRQRPIILLALLLAVPLSAQQIFDPFAGPKKPDTALSDGSTAPVPTPTPTPEPPTIDPSGIGFTWWNDGPAMVEKGNEAYRADHFIESELWYQDAQLKSEQFAAPIQYNQGLALARQGKWSEAVPTLSGALDRSGQDAELKTDLYYSRGTANLHQAQEAAVAILGIEQSGKRLNKKQREELEASRQAAIQLCFDSIDDLGRALERRPTWDDATFNRAQAQHLLTKLTKDPPPDSNKQQQQQQSGDGDSDQGDEQQQGDNEQNQDQQQDQQKNQDEQNGQQDQQDGNQQQQGDQQQDQQSSSGSQQGDSEQQGGQSQSQQGQPAQLTPDQAASLLEMLGQEETVRLRLRTNSEKQRPAKDW